MKNLNGKRLLILGGSTWRNIIADFARENGVVIVAAGNDPNAKFFEIAQETYHVNSTDSDAMKKLIRDKNIDGVHMGGNDFVIPVACEYLKDLDFPCYCTKQQWDNLSDKQAFKNLCREFNLPITSQFTVDIDNLQNSAESIDYPVITKPVDGNGSRGFSVCNNASEFLIGYEKARQNSSSGNVLVEKFVKNSSIVVFYSFSNGRATFSGMGRRYPIRYEATRSYVSALHLFETNLESNFRENFEDKLRALFKSINLREGFLFIEVFVDAGKYYFNEVDYRYMGSLSMYPEYYFHGINQVHSDLYYSLTGISRHVDFKSPIPNTVPRKKYYAIYHVHIKAGTIAEISGIDTIMANNNVIDVAMTKSVGDVVEFTGTLSQIFAFVHFVFDSKAEFYKMINDVHNTIIVSDSTGNNLVNRVLDAENETNDFFEDIENI